MSALTTVKLVLFGVVLVTVVAGIISCALAAAFRADERSFPHPQTDEAGQ